MLDWLFAGARTGAALFATKSGDIGSPGITVLRTRIAFLEQQLQAEEEKLNDRELELPCLLSAASDQVRTDLTCAETSLKRQSALEQEVVSLQNQLSVAISTSKVDVESKLPSVREKLAAANDIIGKLPVEVQTDCNQMD